MSGMQFYSFLVFSISLSVRRVVIIVTTVLEIWRRLDPNHFYTFLIKLTAHSVYVI
jgi:hypothetical protein